MALKVLQLNFLQASFYANPKMQSNDWGNCGSGKERETISESRQQRKVYALTWKLYPTVRGIAQAAVYHPHGGGRHQHIGRQSSVGRTTPPGRKVGNISPRKTGRGRVKERR